MSKDNYKVYFDFLNKNYFPPELLSKITGYSVSSINSYNTGRRKIPEPLIKFIEIYKENQQIVREYNNKIFEIHLKYKTLLDKFSNSIKKEIEELDNNFINIKIEEEK